MLWLSLHFPDLPLEVFTRGTPEAGPFAVGEAHGSRHWILAASPAARARGIHPGMPLGAAHALVQELQVRPRDTGQEAAALEGIATWAGQFSSLVSLAPPQAILLEVGGSRRLYGGLDPLLVHIEAGLVELGYRACPALAPTPTAAWLLARAGRPARHTERDTLAPSLDEIELHHLDLPPDMLGTLHGMGVRHVGACRRLPRAGLARRFGPALLGLLDRAFGHLPDPRTPYEPPPHFAERLPLPAEVESTEALLFAVRRLLLQLAGYLQARGAGVQQLLLELLHRSSSELPAASCPAGPATRVPIGLVAPSRDAQHLLGLLRERLERIELPAPVVDLALTADDIQPLDGQTLELFGRAGRPGEDWPVLVERLSARLGNDAVHGVCQIPDHRPERAWRTCPPGTKGPTPHFGPRPLWLLEPPVPLDCEHGSPRLEGALALLHGPETIETGWWDDADVARDYYVAQDPKGARLWIYRERHAAGRWFLHGMFG
jgi:protein ImuB